MTPSLHQSLGSFRKNSIKGFTLIELLVVIAIIGLLASVTFASLTEVRKSAEYTKARTDIKVLADLATVARIQTGKSLIEITGSLCSEFYCRDRGDIRNIPRTDPCWIDYQSAVTNLNNATNGLYSVRSLPVDPWGAPYLINENEGEVYAGGATCHNDNITSAGPDGLYYNSDDIVYALPELNCQSSLGPHVPQLNWF